MIFIANKNVWDGKQMFMDVIFSPEKHTYANTKPPLVTLNLKQNNFKGIFLNNNECLIREDKLGDKPRQAME